MSPRLQRVLTELDQLAPEEQQQAMEHLRSQLYERAIVMPKPDSSSDAQWNQPMAHDLATGKSDHLKTAAAINNSLVNRLPSETLAERRARAKQVMAATCGSWGNKTRDEIDAKLDRQRREDWGE